MSDDEARAREMGWTSQEEFRGSPDRWIDAESFIRRGEEMLPILKANNKRLEARQAANEARIAQLVDEMGKGQETIKALKEYHDEDVRRQVAIARGRLIEEIKYARKEGDIDAEVEAQAALGRLNEPMEVKKEEPKPAPAPKEHPEFVTWRGENPWFGPGGNEKATAYAVGIAESVQLDPDTKHLTGRAFYDKVNELVGDRFPQLFPDRSPQVSTTSDTRGTPGKVESARIGSSRTTGKSYADLPQVAREACERFIPRLVGKGRAYETADAWRAEYVRKFYSGDEYV